LILTKGFDLSNNTGINNEDNQDLWHWLSEGQSVSGIVVDELIHDFVDWNHKMLTIRVLEQDWVRQEWSTSSIVTLGAVNKGVHFCLTLKDQ